MTRPATKNIGEPVRDWRQMQNLKSEELGDMAGISRSTLSRLEDGDPFVSLRHRPAPHAFSLTDRLADAVDPYETDRGRARVPQGLPQQVRRPT